MKILIIGASGTIGKAIYNHFSKYHEVFGAHRTSKKYSVDIEDKQSIIALFEKLPKLDAVVIAAGTAISRPLDQLTETDYYVGIRSKLMGQVLCMQVAKDYLKDKGSITLTTGILSDHYEPETTALSMVNGALHSLVLTSSQELPRGIRLNVVAPGAIAGAYPKDKLFAGHLPVAINDAIVLYRKAVEQPITGQILKLY
ncbi:short chain dehydrogenase [Aquimarina intermedia]|uniref:NAD(P)-dependent dehydrogenase (Short-subunit alcohol dehydrogenase family) n=1 Tax=Aquimarina intermedia TaxID=350814 RepID=A0A5S5C726_9FLAO|nr:short chain dehydrogenase [Aquimarina intermedia]TYP75215.1 NAD(P)-dependent dehydrogenase (short-subunit alcohol dehydrogenase family) [Aquimarina intermedia]